MAHDGWFCKFLFFSTVFQLYQADEKMIKKRSGQQGHLGKGRAMPTQGFELATTWSKVKNANHSAKWAYLYLNIIKTGQEYEGHASRNKKSSLFTLQSMLLLLASNQVIQNYRLCIEPKKIHLLLYFAAEFAINPVSYFSNVLSVNFQAKFTAL